MRNLLSQGSIVIIGKPHLWKVAITQLWRIRENGWYKKFPFLPAPNKKYINFRLITAYGDEGPENFFKSDLVTYFKWCRAWRVSSK